MPSPRPWRLTLFPLALAAVGLCPLAGAASPPRSDRQDDIPFTLPPGFVAERVAGPPLVEHPMLACLDERGRLFVADSAGRNLPADQLLKQLPNAIRVLEDTRGDGHFDRGRTFADRMTMPMGVLWYKGALYSCSPPALWRLDECGGWAPGGEGSRRRELVARFGFTGNAADIHGPFLGPDGRLYWTDGRHGHEIRLPDGRLLKGLAARIFRCRPDGGDVEVVCGGGMDDPVGIAFTAEGEPIATVDIYLGSPRRVDALIHCVEGGVFPYHPCYREFKSTGGLLPPVADLGWVAPAGLARYRGEAFGPGYRDNLFSAQFNTHKVQRHVLERVGATFQARSEDFLVSTRPDFHPTDVLEDADGSLLVMDTGGWFRIGCPTSQTAKPDVKGAIYRVRRRGNPPLRDPRASTLQWERQTPGDLAALLDDPRWAVRDRAIEELAGRGSAAVPVLEGVIRQDHSVRARRNAVWALCRMGPEARTALRLALADRDASVRQCGAHALGLHRDAGARARLGELAARDTPPVAREAATALGRLRQAEAVPSLLRRLEEPGDRFLEHSLIHALIQIADREGTLRGLRSSSPRVRRASLIALDQMEGGRLTREQVVPLLNTDDPSLRQTVLDVISTRPDWAGEVAGFLRRQLVRADLKEKARDGLRRALLGLGKDPAVQELVAQALAEEQTPAPSKLLLLEVIAETPLDPLPRSWVRELGRALGTPDETALGQALVTLRARGVADLDDTLRGLAADRGRPADMRLAALAALAPRLARVDRSSFAFLLGRLDPHLPPLARLAAAEALGRMPLDDAQLRALAPAVVAAGPLELPHLAAAYERSASPEVGEKLVEALARSPGLAALSPTALRGLLRGYPAPVRQAAQPLFPRLEGDADRQKARLDELEPLLASGAAVRGRGVFFGPRAACSACHAVGAEGGRIGPDLTRIGAIRTGRDLLEAVVFPSASIVRGYEPYLVTTRDGRVHAGILGRQTAAALYLVTAERAEVRIPRSAIDSLTPGRVSIMPQGLDALLSRQELADLIAFLRSLR
jgi:putative heme-binding domain-containing protein